jgi:hypothetical protein
MTAGHILMKTIVSFLCLACFYMWLLTMVAVVGIVPILVFIFAIETVVAILQANLFGSLLVFYFQMFYLDLNVPRRRNLRRKRILSTLT